MKKIFLLLVSMMMLTACSDDDDATTEGEDPILGTWYLVEITNPLEADAQFNECEQQSFITFNDDNTAISESFTEVDGECESEGSDTGNWENEGNSRYTFTIPGFGEQTGEVEFIGNNRFSFSVPDLPGFALVMEK